MVTTQRISPVRHSRYLKVKAVLDIIFAVILLIVLSPFLLLFTLLIVLDSRGPVIYRQQRVGQYGNLFTIYKFRTMRTDAPCLSTEELQRMGINPVTRVGTLLRKGSFDELPQFFNILKGEMSFIGPRPALPSQTDVNTLREFVGVHAVRPGISGLAQVMGRDALDTETKVNYDAEYCRRLSFTFDVQIALLTFRSIISSRGNK